MDMNRLYEIARAITDDLKPLKGWRPSAHPFVALVLLFIEIALLLIYFK
jgi:hypothetical protein